jgi:hypothetical protein
MTIETLQNLLPRFETFGDAPVVIAFAQAGRRAASYRALCDRNRRDGR